LEDGGEGEVGAIGAPGGGDGGGIGADGDLGVAARFAVDEVECPDGKPAGAALAGALESDAVDVAAGAPGGKRPGAEGFSLACLEIKDPDFPLAGGAGEGAIGETGAIGGKAGWRSCDGRW